MIIYAMASGFLKANISVASIVNRLPPLTIGLPLVSFTSRSENEAKAALRGLETLVNLHTTLFSIQVKALTLLMTSHYVRAEPSDI